MSEDQLVALLRRNWGVESAVPSVVVPLPSLIRFVAASYRSVGFAQGWATLLGETGRPLLLGLDRTERQMTYELGDVFK